MEKLTVGDITMIQAWVEKMEQEESVLCPGISCLLCNKLIPAGTCPCVRYGIPYVLAEAKEILTFSKTNNLRDDDENKNS